MEENVRVCDICGRELKEEDGTWVDDEVFRFSRRSTYNMNRWSARYVYENTGKEILKKAKCSDHGRNSAVILCNYKGCYL